jgi:TonB family protein
MRRFLFQPATAVLTFVVGFSAFFVRNAYRSPDELMRSTEKSKVMSSSPPVSVLPKIQPNEEPPPRPTPTSAISGGVLNGRAIEKPAPVYPAIAKAARQQGTFLPQVVVDENGKVISAQVISGSPLLQQAALQAAYQARFNPTLFHGQRVKIGGALTYNFVLE